MIMRKTALVLGAMLLLGAGVVPSAASPLTPVRGAANVEKSVNYQPVRWHGWWHRHYRHWGWYRGYHYGWWRRHRYYGRDW